MPLVQTTERRFFIGGSDARIIMGNDEAKPMRLWQEKRGEIETEDLSQDLLVQLGTITEQLNRTWYERCTGQASGGFDTQFTNGWAPHWTAE